MRRLTLARLAIAAAAAVVIPLGLAAPASADPPGLVVLGSTGASDSTPKTTTILCPPGTMVTGGAGYLTANPPARGWVLLDRLEPLADGSGFTVAMKDVDGYAGAWSLTAKAVCTSPIVGWQRLSATSAASITTATAITTPCGTGRSVIGVGARVNNGAGQVTLDDIIPSDDLKTVTAKAYRIPGGTVTNWTVTAYAICAPTPADLELVSWVTGAASSDPHQSLNFACPDNIVLKGAYSSGFEIFGGNGSVLETGLNAVNTGTASAGADVHHDGYGGNWNLTLYLICGS